MMLSYEDWNKIVDAVVFTDEDSGKSYIEPRWEQIVKDLNLITVEGETEEEKKNNAGMIMFDMRDVLNMEVKKRNAQNDYFGKVAKKLFAMLEESLDPMMQQENEELAMDMLKYQAEKNKITEKELELKEREKQLDTKEDIKLKTGGLNFAKKK